MKKSGINVILLAAALLYLAISPARITSADIAYGNRFALDPAPITFTLSPSATLYPKPIAAQKFPRFALSFPRIILNAIDPNESAMGGGGREIIELGASKSLARISLSHQPDLGFEFSIGAGISTMFDSFADGLDLFGFDGYGHAAIHYRPIKPLAFRFGIHHVSGHIGDEFLANYDVITLPAVSGQDLAKNESYGMFYVRDSILFGISLFFDRAVRVYGEVNYSTRIMRYLYNYNSFPWQVNFGLELIAPQFYESSTEAETKGWYAAADVELYEESSWYPAVTVQAGRIMSAGPSGERFRIGLEYFAGRTPLVTFNHTITSDPTPLERIPFERYISFGIWYDF